MITVEKFRHQLVHSTNPHLPIIEVHLRMVEGLRKSGNEAVLIMSKPTVASSSTAHDILVEIDKQLKNGSIRADMMVVAEALNKNEVWPISKYALYHQSDRFNKLDYAASGDENLK